MASEGVALVTEKVKQGYRPHSAENGKRGNITTLIRRQLSTEQGEAISDLVRNCSTSDESSSLLRVGAHILDEDAKQRGKKLLGQITDPYERLVALSKLLGHLSQEDREQLIDQELMTFERDYHKDKDLWASTIITLTYYRSNLLHRYKDDLVSAFWKLTPESQAQFAKACGENGISDFVERVFGVVFLLPGTKRAHLLSIIAPVLSAAQLTKTVNWLESEQHSVDSDLIVALILQAAKLGKDEMALSALKLLLDKHFVSYEVIENVTRNLPGSLIPKVSHLVGDKNSWRAALALRAAKTGDIELALCLFGDKTASLNEGQTFEEICDLAARTWVDRLVSFAQENGIRERASGFLKLIAKTPKYKRRELITAIVESASTFRGGQSEKRLAIFRGIEPELKTLPLQSLVSLWMKALEASSEHGRSEILVDICAFSPTLVARFGSEMALGLDDVVNLAGRDAWP